MARSPYSPSVSPRSISPSFSDSSAEDESSGSEPIVGPYNCSPPGSPAPGDKDKSAKNAEPDAVTCLWDDCGVIFTHLPTLITHIHEEHIGVHKSNYTCEWSTCSRRGLAQTSRFALISHIRSHTGEKPFTCPRPECDKSFTRSDALAKHMRLQHNIEPPLPGRGGNRKRKHNDIEPSPPIASATGGFTTFKVESSTPVEFYIEEGDGRRVISPIEHVRVDYFSTDGQQGAAGGQRTPSPPDDDAWDDDTEDFLPAHFMHALDPSTGLIMGRSPDMVRYLVMKAKHRYALEQHEHLIEDLRMARYELGREKEAKEAMLDEFLRTTFGPQADPFIVPIPHIHRQRHSTVGSGSGSGVTSGV